MKEQRLSARLTGTGALIHWGASIFWGTLFETLLRKRRSPPARIIRIAAVTAATAYVVDYHVVPKRITPGFEAHMPRRSFLPVYLALGAGCHAIDQPELAFDERFDTNAKRVERHAEIKLLVESWTRRHNVDDVVETMLAAGVPASPINTVDRLVTDPHIAGARQMFVDMEHPKAGKTKLTGCHIKLSATPAHLRSPAPQLGEHNAAVFGGLLGLTADELAKLQLDGVI
ncbi:CoA transferase [Caballeronia sp. EK]|uniref:CoA transferase n=1 Tax=Caballeronia sp. EK TaxID=2767469 RepID=UPI0019C92639|nr:CoA transferase [Caballeronia sp. EK]MBC8642254.1 CoA transferase [Caballeronia sp. EK]